MNYGYYFNHVTVVLVWMWNKSIIIIIIIINSCTFFGLHGTLSKSNKLLFQIKKTEIVDVIVVI